MQTSVSGQHIPIENSLQDYVKNRTGQIITKYFTNIISTNIHFSKHGVLFICDILVNDGTGRHMLLKGNASSDDIYSSFDIAISKLEKQLRKYKSKLKDRHEKIKISEENFRAVKYVIAPYQPEDELDSDINNHPIIIAEKSLETLTLSVNQAVMKMDLENLPALMFYNINSNRINIIYYRRDGNISWIDSK